MIQYDCHAHIYEQIPKVSGTRYTPISPAPLATWQKNLDKHQLLGGVIVQVSFLGTDNSELCNALQKLNPIHFAGVAVTSFDVADSEIDRLKGLGVRGFRWNLVHGAQIPDLKQPIIRNFLERVFMRGMHIEVHLEGDRLSPIISSLLSVGGNVVVDHLGLPVHPKSQQDPWIQALKKIKDTGGLYVKYSAPYRTVFDISEHAAVIADLLQPDHIIWGSDWPHTQHESAANYDVLAEYRHSLPILSDANAVRSLYGLGTVA